jgi:hypothetical protein
MSFDPLPVDADISPELMLNLESYKLALPIPAATLPADMPRSGFLERCATAALVGRDIVKLRITHKSPPNFDRGVLEYLSQLATDAQVRLERLVAELGLQRDATAPEFATAWGQLARQIGLPITTAFDLLLWSMLKILHPELMPMQARFRSSSDRAQRAADPSISDLLPDVSTATNELLANSQAAFEAAFLQHDEI